MKTMGSREVQNNFGQVSNLVLQGEEVVVTQYGRPTLAIVAYNVWQEAMQLYKVAKMKEYMDSLSSNPAAADLSLEDINTLVHELRP